MADIERNIETMRACDGGGGGWHALLYRTVTGAYVPPQELMLGRGEVFYDDADRLFERLDVAVEGELPLFTAVDIIRICQRTIHHDRVKTVGYSSRAEWKATVVLAGSGAPMELRPTDLYKPTLKQPNIYHTNKVIGTEPAGRLVQVHLGIGRRRPLQAAVRAAISDPHRPTYVALGGYETFLQRPEAS